MSVDMLERLRIDPGRRTLGELLQERQWAAGEIERLRHQIAQLAASARQSVVSGARVPNELPAPEGMGPQRLLRLAEVCRIVGVSRAMVYVWMKEGRFPMGVHLGDRMVRWRVSEVEAWLAAR